MSEELLMGTAIERSMAAEIVLLQRIVRTQAETIETQAAIIQTLRERPSLQRPTAPLPLTRNGR